MANRKFKCNNCSHEWELPYCDGHMGINLICPKCSSSSVHRVNSRGYQHGRRLCRRENFDIKDDSK